MAVSVVHATSAAGPNDPSKQVSSDSWNAAHTVTGLGTFATQDFATPPAIGGTTPAAGSFTTLSASSTVSGAGFSTYLASPPAIGGTAPAAGTFTTLTANTSPHVFGDGTAATFALNSNLSGATDPTLTFGNSSLTLANGALIVPDAAAGTPAICGLNSSTSGIYFSAGSTAISVSAALKAYWDATNYYLFPAGFNLTFSGASGGANDSRVMAPSANALRYSAAAATTTSSTKINKSVTAIADATPTATFTVTIPNAAHSGMLKVTLVGSLGAGGAIGANEASATVSYDIVFTRTAGVNATALISAAYGAAATAVAGAATVTCTAAMSAVSGAVGATNTFTVNVTITKSAGTSANHTCLCYGRLMNANATGITIA